MQALAVAATGVALGVSLVAQRQRRWRPRVAAGVLDAVGNTPLIELRSLSRATGCRILAKVGEDGHGVHTRH